MFFLSLAAWTTQLASLDKNLRNNKTHINMYAWRWLWSCVILSVKRLRNVVVGSLRPGLWAKPPLSIPVPFVLFCSALFCISICSGCKHPQKGGSILSVCIMPIYSWCWQTRKAAGEGNEWCQSCHWVCQRPTFLINEKAVKCYCCNAAAYMIHKCFSLLYLVIVKEASQAGRLF